MCNFGLLTIKILDHIRCKTRWPSEAQHISLTLTVIYIRSNLLESNQVAVQILRAHTAAVRWCNTRTRVSLDEFRGHKGQVSARHAGALEELQQESERRQREGWENHNHASCVWFPASCQEISLCVPDLSYPIPPSSPLAALPTPTLDRTQMVWIKRSAWLGCGYRSLLRSDSLLSLNTPPIRQIETLSLCGENSRTHWPRLSPRSGKGCARGLLVMRKPQEWRAGTSGKTTKQEKATRK